MKATIYQRTDGAFYINARAVTDQDIPISAPPFQKLAITCSDDELVRAIDLAFDAYMEGVPHPTDWNPVGRPMYKLAGVRTWAAFSNGTESLTLERIGPEVKVISLVNLGPRSGFALDRSVPPVTVKWPDEVAATVRRLLKRHSPT